MRFDFLGRVSRLAAIGAILLGSASCVNIDETLGESLIPTDQKWDVFTPEAVDLTDIRLQLSDSLSGYSSTRFTFGAINDEKLGTCMKSSSFTLVPVWDSLDFGRNTKVKQFHFSAVRDTLSTVYDKDQLILQNVYVSELKKPLDSTVIYIGSFADPKVLEEFVDLSNRITVGTPVYAGGDSLSFDFSLDFAERFVEKLKKADMDSVNAYINDIPGIYFYTDTPAGPGGRINMFELEIQTNSYHYLTGNYAELKFTAEYDHSDEPVDTSFTFLFGPSNFIKIDDKGNVTYPTQVAFNAGNHESSEIYGGNGVPATDKIYVEGGSGVKPVVKAEGIKRILDKMLADAGITDPSQVVINKATIMMPYNVEGDYDLLEKYPDVLSPTVRLRSTEGNYISYAGLTDSSIESENQGNINRSTFMYAPDISHHVQEILKLDRNDADYKKNIEKYDIWFLINHAKVKAVKKTSNQIYCKIRCDALE